MYYNTIYSPSVAQHTNCLFTHLAQESPHKSANLRITSTYKYEIRNTFKLCYALPFPSNMVAGDGVLERCTNT